MADQSTRNSDLEDLFPAHKASLHLEHNPHKNNYESVSLWIDDYDDLAEWQSEEEKRKSVESGELWTLQWYPNTPVAFHCVAAASLESLLAFAKDFPPESSAGGNEEA